METRDTSPAHHQRGNISSLVAPPTLELSFLPRSHHVFSPKALCIAEVLNFLPKRAALSAAPYQDKSTWQRALHYAASATRRAALETPRRGPSSAPAGVPGLPFLVLPALGCSAGLQDVRWLPKAPHRAEPPATWPRSSSQPRQDT